MQLNLKSTSKKLLYLFLVTDIVFIILHLLHAYFINVYFPLYSDTLSNLDFSLEQDRGYGEIFQYIKEYWIAILLGILARQRRSILYLGWSLLFVYLLFDDALSIHETLGHIIADKLSLSAAFNLRARDFGELLVSAFFGLFFLILIGTVYRFSESTSRKASKYLIKMLLALAFCGIAVDMAHMAIKSIPSFLLVILEDGGEMVVMSLIAWFVFVLPDLSSTTTNALEDQFSLHRTEAVSHKKF